MHQQAWRIDALTCWGYTPLSEGSRGGGVLRQAKSDNGILYVWSFGQRKQKSAARQNTTVRFSMLSLMLLYMLIPLLDAMHGFEEGSSFASRCNFNAHVCFQGGSSVPFPSLWSSKSLTAACCASVHTQIKDTYTRHVAYR